MALVWFWSGLGQRVSFQGVRRARAAARTRQMPAWTRAPPHARRAIWASCRRRLSGQIVGRHGAWHLDGNPELAAAGSRISGQASQELFSAAEFEAVAGSHVLQPTDDLSVFEVRVAVELEHVTACAGVARNRIQCHGCHSLESLWVRCKRRRRLRRSRSESVWFRSGFGLAGQPRLRVFFPNEAGSAGVGYRLTCRSVRRGGSGLSLVLRRWMAWRTKAA
jgi:hypothetical protein